MLLLYVRNRLQAQIMATSESMLGQADNISKNSGQVEISAEELAASAEQLSNQVQQFHI